MNFSSEFFVKVAVFIVDRLDARAIHRQQLAPEKIELPAQQRELAEHGAEGGSIVAPEGGGIRPRTIEPGNVRHAKL
jgi:hypothetical protein